MTYNVRPNKAKTFGRSLLEHAEALYHLAVTVAVIVGGGWAVYTYVTSQEESIAKSSLEQIKADIDEKQGKLEQLKAQLQGANSSNIQISEKINELPNGHFGVVLNVLVQNTGEKNVSMHWDGSPLKVFKMDYRKGDQVAFRQTLSPKIYAPYEGKKQHYEKLFLFIGVKKELSFFVELESEGLYYVTFKALTDEETSENVNDAGHWFTSKYIYVKNNESQKQQPIIVDVGHLFQK